MPISKKIINFLEKNKAKYEAIRHRTVYTAFDKAATLRVPQKIIGKTLIVRVDKNPVLILIPANKNLDLQKLKKITKAKKADFIREAWMKKQLVGVKVGAVPPFGNLWGLPTFVDQTLMKNPKIIVSGGNYNWSLKMRPAELKKLTPGLILGNFSKAKK